ncbi:MAG TPA: hypothetical protein VEG32_07680 [Clostridia bacterium]|nr:hypothetical protein [Clostridia bacterium]
MINQSVLDAFQLMWGPFPEPVMLIHKNRTVLAVNDLSRSLGITTGIKCYSLNPTNKPDEHCRQCKGNAALRAAQTMCSEEVMADGSKVLGYWMPLNNVPDVYVHFGIGTAESLRKQSAASPTPELVSL